jgi:hypothetical protein
MSARSIINAKPLPASPKKPTKPQQHTIRVIIEKPVNSSLIIFTYQVMKSCENTRLAGLVY